jgi:hypothetical protein
MGPVPTVKYKWQREMIKEIEELNFNDALERVLFVASLGDHMIHRDLWELNYLEKHIKDLYYKKCFDR